MQFITRNIIPLHRKLNVFFELYLPKLSTSTIHAFSTQPHLPLSQLSDEEVTIRDTVAQLSQSEILPKVKHMDEFGELDQQVLRSLFKSGLMGIETEEKMDGLGASFMSAILAVEELAKVDPSISVICDVQNTLVNTLIRKFGTDNQQQKYLPLLATKKVGCFCLSEASSGSDAFALKTTAKKQSSSYIINGEKLWITNSKEADIFLIFANVNQELGYKGITCFIVDKEIDVQGGNLAVGKKENKLGIRASSTCPVVFEDLKIDEAQVLGEPGKGYKYAIEILNEGRIGIAAQMLGLSEGVYQLTLPYLFERKQFGEFIGDFQGLQHQYAQIATEIEAARLLTYNAARLKDLQTHQLLQTGQSSIQFVKEAAMAKLYTSQVASKTSSLCIEWMGGLGFTKDYPMEKFYRDCKIGAIYEGTSNIQLQTIAKYIRKQFKQD